MTKLIYPEDGLYNKIKDSNNMAVNDLELSMQYTNFNIPADFNYRNYLLNLSNNLKNIKKEINLISDKIKINDSYLENTVNDLVNSAKTIDKDKINLRENLIK